MTSNQPQKDRLTRLKEHLLSGPQNSHEESARLKAAREEAYGTSFEWAELQEDLSVSISVEQWLTDGTQGHGTSISKPGDSDYQALLETHRLKKPGDASTVIRKWIDDQWKLQEPPSKD